MKASLLCFDEKESDGRKEAESADHFDLKFNPTVGWLVVVQSILGSEPNERDSHSILSY